MLQRRKQHQPGFHDIAVNLQRVGHWGESGLSAQNQESNEAQHNTSHYVHRST